MYATVNQVRTLRQTPERIRNGRANSQKQTPSPSPSGKRVRKPASPHTAPITTITKTQPVDLAKAEARRIANKQAQQRSRNKRKGLENSSCMSSSSPAHSSSPVRSNSYVVKRMLNSIAEETDKENETVIQAHSVKSSPTKQREAFRFKKEDDVALLQACLAQRVWIPVAAEPTELTPLGNTKKPSSRRNFSDIAVTMSKNLGMNIKERTCYERYQLLSKYHTDKEHVALKSSGLFEEHEDIDNLLEDLVKEKRDHQAASNSGAVKLKAQESLATAQLARATYSIKTDNTCKKTIAKKKAALELDSDDEENDENKSESESGVEAQPPAKRRKTRSGMAVHMQEFLETTVQIIKDSFAPPDKPEEDPAMDKLLGVLSNFQQPARTEQLAVDLQTALSATEQRMIQIEASLMQDRRDRKAETEDMMKRLAAMIQGQK